MPRNKAERVKVCIDGLLPTKTIATSENDLKLKEHILVLFVCLFVLYDKRIWSLRVLKVLEVPGKVNGMVLY